MGEWLGIMGLTLSAGVVWTAGNGGWGTEALVLWGLTFLYFGGSVPYVRLRVKQMKAKGHTLWESLRQAKAALLYSSIVLATVVIAEAAGQLPALAIIPFALTMVKVTWFAVSGQGPKRIAHVGYSEIVFSTVFAVATVAAFWPT